MGEESGIRQSKAIEIESGIIKKHGSQENGFASAHVTDNDSWQQVGLLLVTAFNCAWILSYSSLVFVPLGWVFGVSSLVVFGLFTAYGNWLLAEFHFVEGQRFIRYRDIMGFLFGKKMYYLTWFLQFSNLVLGNMGSILLGGLALKEINLAMSDSTWRLQYFIIMTGAAYCIFSFVVPNMSAMRVWLGASGVLTFCYIGFVFAISVKDGISNKDKDYQVVGSKVDKAFDVISIVTAVIVTNTSGMLLEIQSTLRKPAVKNMKKALFTQYTLGLMVYYGVCIVGYWAYGTQVSQYLPKQLSGPRWAKILINAAAYLQNIISQHMFFQPVHEALDTKFLNLGESTYSRQNMRRRFILRVFVFTGNTLVTAAIPFMGDFINLSGSFALVPLTFIFPSMIFLKVKWKTAGAGKKAWHWTIILFSCFLAIATSASAIRMIVKDIKQYHFFADA